MLPLLFEYHMLTVLETLQKMARLAGGVSTEW